MVKSLHQCHQSWGFITGWAPDFPWDEFTDTKGNDKQIKCCSTNKSHLHRTRWSHLHRTRWTHLHRTGWSQPFPCHNGPAPRHVRLNTCCCIDLSLAQASVTSLTSSSLQMCHLSAQFPGNRSRMSAAHPYSGAEPRCKGHIQRLEPSQV